MTYPRVLPETYGSQNPGRDLADAIGSYIGHQRQQKFDDQSLQEGRLRIAGEQSRQDYESRVRPLEEALYRANLYRSGVRSPEQRAATTPSPYFGGTTTTDTPRGPIDTPNLVDTAGLAHDPIPNGVGGAGRSAGPVTMPNAFQRPGQFNPTTGSHNQAMDMVELGGGYGYEDPAEQTSRMFSRMGASPEESYLAGRNPQIGERYLQDRRELPYKETPGQRFDREMTLEEARERLRFTTSMMLSRARGEIAGAHGEASMKQLLDWADMNFSGFGGGAALSPDARYQLAREMFAQQHAGKGQNPPAPVFPKQPSDSASTGKPKHGFSLFGFRISRDKGEQPAQDAEARTAPAPSQPTETPPAAAPPTPQPTAAAPPAQAGAEKRVITKDQRDFLIAKGRWRPELYDVR